jgi:hypothetical protein
VDVNCGYLQTVEPSSTANEPYSVLEESIGMTDQQFEVLNSSVVLNGRNVLLGDVKGNKTGVYLMSVSLFLNNAQDNTTNTDKQLRDAS